MNVGPRDQGTSTRSLPLRVGLPPQKGGVYLILVCEYSARSGPAEGSHSQATVCRSRPVAVCVPTRRDQIRFGYGVILTGEVWSIPAVCTARLSRSIQPSGNNYALLPQLSLKAARFHPSRCSSRPPPSCGRRIWGCSQDAPTFVFLFGVASIPLQLLSRPALPSCGSWVICGWWAG